MATNHPRVAGISSARCNPLQLLTEGLRTWWPTDELNADLECVGLRYLPLYERAKTMDGLSEIESESLPSEGSALIRWTIGRKYVGQPAQTRTAIFSLGN